MNAKFLVGNTFLLPSRSLFVLEGTVVDGEVRPGMNLLIAFDRDVFLTRRIESVEFVLRSGTERLALAVRYDQPGEGELLQRLSLSNETVWVSDCKA